MSRFARAPSVLLGLIGQDIQGSRTPEMHMREAEAQGLRCVYRLIDLAALGLGLDALPDLLTGCERLGFDGLNITHPCKQAIIPHLDDLSEDARALGAVNTVLFRKEGTQVGVVDGEGVVHLRNVTIGQDYGTSLEITSGVTKADSIVINPSDSIADGTKVQATEIPNPLAAATKKAS